MARALAHIRSGRPGALGAACAVPPQRVHPLQLALAREAAAVQRRDALAALFARCGIGGGEDEEGARRRAEEAEAVAEAARLAEERARAADERARARAAQLLAGLGVWQPLAAWGVGGARSGAGDVAAPAMTPRRSDAAPAAAALGDGHAAANADADADTAGVAAAAGAVLLATAPALPSPLPGEPEPDDAPR